MEALRRWFVNDGSSGDDDRLDLLRVVPFGLLHVGAVLAFWVGVAPIDAAVALALYWVRMFAITAFYHRYFSHRAFDASRARPVRVRVARRERGAARTRCGGPACIVAITPTRIPKPIRIRRGTGFCTPISAGF